MSLRKMIFYWSILIKAISAITIIIFCMNPQFLVTFGMQVYNSLCAYKHQNKFSILGGPVVSNWHLLLLLVSLIVHILLAIGSSHVPNLYYWRNLKWKLSKIVSLQNYRGLISTGFYFYGLILIFCGYSLSSSLFEFYRQSNQLDTNLFVPRFQRKILELCKWIWIRYST